MQHTTKAVLTGHSRGLGAAIAEKLLELGIPVLAVSRKTNPGLATRFPDLLLERTLDLTDSAALAGWLDSPESKDFCAGAQTLLLINNAGMLGPIGPLDSQAPGDIARAVALNVATPLMIAAALAGLHRGELRILHISSGAARSAYAGWSLYCATKAALDHHARAVAADGRTNLRICSLAPGVVDTDMQTEVRSTTEDRFPMLKKFEKMKREGLLASPEATAGKIVAYLLGNTFGETPTSDVRELGELGSHARDR